MRVKLSEEGKEVFPRTPNRRGTIKSGNWPEDKLYSVIWSHTPNGPPDTIHRKFLEEDTMMEIETLRAHAKAHVLDALSEQLDRDSAFDHVRDRLSEICGPDDRIKMVTEEVVTDYYGVSP